MKRKTIILLFICFLLATPGILERMKKEATNDLQLIIPFEEIEQVALAENLPLDHVLNELKQLGLQSLSLAPVTLKTLTNTGEALLYDQVDFARIQENPELLKGRSGSYLFIPPHSAVDKIIQEKLPVLPIFLNEKQYYFLPMTSEQAEMIPLGYDHEVIAKITANGFDYHIILPAAEHFDQDSFSQFIDEQRKTGMVAFLFSGNTVPGYPSKAKVEKLAETFNTEQIPWLFPELHKITGLREFAQAIDYRLYRIHSLNLAEIEPQTAVNRAVRAIKERKITALYLHLPINGEDPFKATTAFIEQFKQKSTHSFSQGFSELLHSPSHLISIALALLAQLLFTLILTRNMSPLGKYLLIALNFLLAVGYLIFTKIIFLQLLLFFLVILTPIYAFILIKATPIQKVTRIYLQTLFIHLIGIACIISLSNDIRLLVGVEVFRFVKLAYLIPISIIAIYYLQPFFKTRFWRQAITYQHLSWLLLLFALSYFYVSRTGNNGFILPFELSLRQSLEDMLYVRPRTKEFLVGFPAFIFALHLLKIGKLKLAYLFLIIGTIGFTSLLNTFLHFHIPVSISILRSVYSIVFGYLLGGLVILLFEKTRRFLTRGILK